MREQQWIMIGQDAEGNPIKLGVPEGTVLPKIGTLRYDDNKRVNGYFCSAGWMPLPINPALFQMQPYLITES